MDLCSFCLTKGRKLNSLGIYSELYLTLINGSERIYWNSEISKIIICWECKAMLKNITKFKNMILKANSILNHFKFELNKIQPSQSYSNLKISNQTASINKKNTKTEIKSEENLQIKKENNCISHGEIRQSQIEITQSEIEVENCELGWSGSDDNVPLQYHAKKKKKTGKKCKVKSKSPKHFLQIRKYKYSDRFERYVMNEDEMIHFRQEIENNKWYYRKDFKCEGCLKGFHNQTAYDSHMSKYHIKRTNAKKCDICTCYIPSDKLDKHRLSHYSGFICRVCGVKCHAFRDIWRHFTALHDKSVVYPCRRCDKVLPTRPAYRYHVRNVHGQQIKCEYCGKICTNSTSFKAHLRQHTGMPLHECHICHKMYRGEHGIRRHMTVHSEDRSSDAYCAECGIQFKSIYIYRVHLKKSLKHVDSDQPGFSCDECGKKFFRKVLLKAHLSTHNPSMHQCQYCPKKYRKKVSLNQHVSVVHDGNPPLKNQVCEICGRGFSTKAVLESHVRTHTGARPFLCQLCPANFAQKSAMYTHKRLVHKIPLIRKKMQ